MAITTKQTAANGPEIRPKIEPEIEASHPPKRDSCSRMPLPDNGRMDAPRPQAKADTAAAYAELHCLTNFSFQHGASHPEELVAQAQALGYHSIAITDICSVAGVVRAHLQAKKAGIRIIIGTELKLCDGPKLVLLATNRQGYAQMVSLITQGRRQADKGDYKLSQNDLNNAQLDNCLAIWLPLPAVTKKQCIDNGNFLKAVFKKRLWLGLSLLGENDDSAQLKHAEQLSEELGLPLVACGDIRFHSKKRKPLHDVLTAIRLGKPVAECGQGLLINAERHLRSRQRLQRIYPPALLEESVRIAERCQFSLGELRYEYPKELVPEGYTPTTWLAELTRRGANKRWPQGVPSRVQKDLDKELKLIAELQYEPFFLTVYDTVKFAQSRGILCQGRGSAANSAVCYAIGITAVDPARSNLLFERFLSKERHEPPDIDVDFEHERREEVIQYLYQKYGRHRAALAATVISYRSKSAIRDVGKALGFSLDQIDRLAKSMQWWDGHQVLPERLAGLGFDPSNPKLIQLLALVSEIIGFPRHLSQHVGGFVIAQDNLANLVPVENASMADRTVIQWEKDDLEALGLLKVDVLALGMLTAIRKCFELIKQTGGPDLDLASIPEDDPATFKMIQRADTIGVFQIESRAQMSMLPRLRPARFYDLVIEVAIVRPGPIQGGMVHPFLQRRNNPDLVEYPSPEVKGVLERTLGVPIFQEQVMKLAEVAAGFTPGEADELRRGMAAWKRKGGLEKFADKLFKGMAKNGYTDEFAHRIFEQIKGFGDYGFPESHAASFALLAWVSSWLKCHYPAAFTASLLNSQPMGFYQPSQLIQDAQRHGVTVRPVDIHHSEVDCSLEPERPASQKRAWALRLGLRMVKGLSADGALRLVNAREQQSFANLQDLAERAQLDKKDLEALAAADALQSSGHRHKAFWEVAAIENNRPALLKAMENRRETTLPLLPKPTELGNVVADYNTIGLSLRQHALALLREKLNQKGICTAAGLHDRRNNSIARLVGIVLNRQRPQTASGVMFMTIEDETGHSNIIVWPSVLQQQRQVALSAKILMVSGIVQQADNVLHLVAGQLTDCSSMLSDLETVSRDFH